MRSEETVRSFQRLGLKAKEVHRLVETEPPARNFFHTRFHQDSANDGRAGQGARQVGGPMSALSVEGPHRRDRSSP